MKQQLEQVIVIACIFTQYKTPQLKYFIRYKSKTVKMFNFSCQKSCVYYFVYILYGKNCLYCDLVLCNMSHYGNVADVLKYSY